MIENQNTLVVQEKRGVLTLRNVSTYGLGAVAATALTSNANAAIDVSGPIAALTTDGTTAITAVGTALLALAGIAVVFKWVKAAFFS